MAVTQRRKLLTAAVGIATVSYVVACEGLVETSGNLVAPGGYGGNVTSGNLPAPPPPTGEGGSGEYPPTSGNLVSPPPQGGTGPVLEDAGGDDPTPPAPDSGTSAAASDASVDTPDSAP